MAESLFAGDPYVVAAHAIYLLGLGDTTGAVPLVAQLSLRPERAIERMKWRASFLLELRRGDQAGAAVIADSAGRTFQGEEPWYRQYRQ